jgi:hypothetical protein
MRHGRHEHLELAWALYWSTLLMPRRTWHRETGTLRFNRVRFELHLDNGGFWILDVPNWRKARSLLGQRVTVEGIRAGFNLLDVARLESVARLPRTSRRPWLKAFLDESYRLFASIF